MQAGEYHFMITIITVMFFFTTSLAFAQDETPVLQKQDLIIIFGSFVISILILVIYIARNVILNKKNRYDKNKFESQKDRDYEKYHSKWGDDWGWKNNRKKKNKDKRISEDYYSILGVEKNATKNEIKSKYRELVKKSHPDKVKDKDSEQIIKINQAYEVLSDDSLRKEYDEYFDD